MPKDSNLKHNYLNISVLSRPVDGGNENDFTYSRYLAKLLRRFVRFVVPDSELSSSDRDTKETSVFFFPIHFYDRITITL